MCDEYIAYNTHGLSAERDSNRELTAPVYIIEARCFFSFLDCSRAASARKAELLDGYTAVKQQQQLLQRNEVEPLPNSFTLAAAALSFLRISFSRRLDSLNAD